MRTKVPTPAKSSSPASVDPGVRPLAAQAAASQSSWAAMVSAITWFSRSARAAAPVLAQPGAWSATRSTTASSAAVSGGVAAAAASAPPAGCSLVGATAPRLVMVMASSLIAPASVPRWSGARPSRHVGGVLEGFLQPERDGSFRAIPGGPLRQVQEFWC